MASSIVKFRFKCKDLVNKDTLSKSDPKIALFTKSRPDGLWKFAGSTETIQNNLNPAFKTVLEIADTLAIELPYVFEKAQPFLVRVTDEDGACEGHYDTWTCQQLGYAESTISRIIGSRGMVKLFSLNHEKKPEKSGTIGTIEIFGEVVDKSAPVLELNLAARDLLKMDLFGKSDPFARFHKCSQEITVHETEVIKKTLNPDWKPLSISTTSLTSAGDLDEPLWIEVFDWDSDSKSEFIGECKISINELVKKSGQEITLSHKPGSKKEKKGKKLPGYLIVQHAALVQCPSFESYIAGGMQISLMGSVDFTLSNGIPNNPNSLHYDTTQCPSQYSQCLSSIGGILAPYDWDNSFPIYGFGGNVPGIGLSHCFNLSNTPEVNGVEGMIHAYRTAIQQVALYGPTYFAPTIRQALAWATDGEGCCQSYQKYSVLLIITDGEICDMDATISAIVDASHAALSIVIVGVGNASFDNMDELDGDDGLLKSGSKRALRDIVQFVPFNQYRSDPSLLAAETLREIPQQVEEYMKLKKITPNPPPNYALPSGNTQQFMAQPSAPSF